MSALTERNVQTALWWKLHSSADLLIPNYTPDGWFECDLWYLSKRGYACEFEIKLTRNDFRSDALKSRDLLSHMRVRQTVSKYDKLAQGSPDGPSRFVYVAPRGVIPLDELPPWAGLWEFNPAYTITCKPTRNAPRLHKIEVPEKIRKHARGVFYWRFWNMRVRMHPSAPPFGTKQYHERAAPPTDPACEQTE